MEVRDSTWRAGLVGRLVDPRIELRAWGMLAVTVSCQLATVVLTWPLWQVREFPPQLSALGVSPFSFGPLVVASLIFAVVWPRAGVLIHGAALVAACIWDQLRIQPQIFVLWILMLGCTYRWGAWLARWLLASMWLWAGLHKFFSPEWFGPVGWTLLERAGVDPAGLSLPTFTVAVAGTETVLGLLTIFAPRYAAPLCLAVHAGILAFLSPWMADYNPSVWPWNLGVACVGTWLLATGDFARPKGAVQWLAAVVILAMPAGYYVNWVEAHLANVLYSENMPKGWITTADGLKPIVGWENVAVPFPDSHRLSVRYFAAVGTPGEKLMVVDPRAWVDDAYYRMDQNRDVVTLDRDEFLRGGKMPDGSVAVEGIEPDNRLSQYHLMRAGARTRADSNGMWQTMALDGSEVSDEDLKWLAGLPGLRMLLLRGPGITDNGLASLETLPGLRLIVLEGTGVTGAGARRLQEQLPECRIEYSP